MKIILDRRAAGLLPARIGYLLLDGHRRCNLMRPDSNLNSNLKDHTLLCISIDSTESTLIVHCTVMILTIASYNCINTLHHYKLTRFLR